MATQSAVTAPGTKAAIAQAAYKAYETKDRAALEAIIADDFHFTSPLDNRLDRATYFKVCWPNSEVMAGFKNIYEFEKGDQAIIVYEASTSTGKQFRNSEVHTVRAGKLVATEVYFGWDLPHKVAVGTHVENQGQGHG